MTPRLMNMDQTAEYLGASRSWFSRKRDQLEQSGFPLPALPHDQFGGARWDRKAIDLWLDRKSNILVNVSIKKTDAFDQHAVDARLAMRAQALASKEACI